MTSALARARHLVGTGVGLALAGTAALAQQGWEPTVSVGAAPKPPVRAPVKVAAPKAMPVTPAPEPMANADDEMAAAKVASPPAATIETGSTKAARADDYCANIAAPAADARFAWQKKMLADMEQEIAKRIALLEEKTAEYQKWLARRDEFSRKANDTVLSIYARMRPDAAAAQLAALDGETAASVLTKLQPRIASLILNEMEPTHAVRLTATISGAANTAPAENPKTAPEARAK